LPFAFGHYLSLLLRNVNALLAPSLVNSLSLSPGQLGLLTSAFFFTYALVQLPVGLALDRYGPRKVQLLLLLLAAVGALLFASGHTFGELVIARAVIGLGLAGCFMSAVKALSACVAPSRLPSINGYLLAVGGLGSASATLPVRLALQYTDWRGLFVLLAVLTALTALVIWLLVPQAPPAPSTKPASFSSLRNVYLDPEFRKTTSLILIPHTVFFGIQGLWLGRWMSDVAHFSDAAVAYLLYLSMAGVIFGAIAVGLITERAGRLGIKPLDLAAVGICLFLLIQGAFILNHKPSMQLLGVLFTLVGTITGIEYTIIAQSVPRELTGRASTCLNLLIFVGAFVVQAGFGQVIGLWHPDAAGHYPAVAYQVGFGLLILLQLPGLVKYFLQRRPVKCAIPEFILEEEEYEVSSLRSPR
jgi:predicted MFS family arabinose efflux permease